MFRRKTLNKKCKHQTEKLYEGQRSANSKKKIKIEQIKNY